jgi:Glycosyl transferase family 2
MATVTVSIPTYNRSAYLREALESVLTQSFEDFTVLVSDNGSTDGTREMVEEYARADARICYHRFPKNQGLASNFRYCTCQPETEFVALLPDDDLWLPHHLASAVDALRSVPRAVIYGCAAEFFGDSSGHDLHQPYWVVERQSRQVIDSSTHFAPWLKETPIAPVSVVFKSAARQGIDLYQDDSFGPMDWLFWGAIAMRGVTVVDSVVGARLRWHQQNQSHVLLKGKRGSVQGRYVMRQLAAQALTAGALTSEGLVAEVLKWPLGSAANLVVALAAYDANPSLRRAAVEIFNRKHSLGSVAESSKHCRMAGRVGDWYLGIADPFDRLLGRWWRPTSQRGTAT